MAAVAMGGTWYMVSRLNQLSLNRSAIDRSYNARVLNRAKQALIGYVAAQAAKNFEYNPGSLPCPEDPGDFNSATGGDGQAGSGCGSSLKVGRYPWRTIGTEQLRDASGEPLWYVVSTSWGVPTSGNSVVNSNSTGGLTLDNTANAAVALIIAPGLVANVSASTGCSAWSQSRPTSGTPDWRNYLECENATSPADVTFVTNSTNSAFNDQMVAISAAELLPGIEAAVASRMEREFGPRLRSWLFTTRTATKATNATTLTVSSTRGMQAGDTIGIQLFSGAWGWTTISSVDSSTSLTLAANTLTTASGTKIDVVILRPRLPYAASLPVSTTTTFEGVSGQQAGLFPSTYSTTGACSSGPPCTPAACDSTSDSRCQPGFVDWRNTATLTRTSGATLNDYACGVSGTPSVLTCTINAYTSILGFTTTMDFYIDATANNVGMAFRQINPMVSVSGVDTSGYNTPYGYTISNKALNADGSASIRINAQVTGGGTILAALGSITCSFFGIPLCFSYTVSVPVAMFSDHLVLDAAKADYTWFTRNKWHELAYYAVAPGYLPSGAGSCATSSTCLQVDYHTDSTGASDAGKLRGVLILGGRALSGQTRPANAVADLLEGANADGTSPFEARSATLQPNRTFNDRFAVIDTN
jgi:hypothetical protein